MIDTERAWAAGFFDGEGTVCFRKQHNKYERISLQIAQCNGPELLLKFKIAVENIGSVGGPYNHKNPDYSEFWTYSVQDFQSVQYVMILLWEYLGEVKRAQFKKCVCQYLFDYNSVDFARNKKRLIRKTKFGNKYCPECKEEKSIDNFYKDISKKDKKSRYCKVCNLARNKRNK